MLLIALLAATVGQIPATTRVAVDYEVQVKTIPLYLKVAGFLTRHWQYKQLVREVLKGRDDPEEQVLALFDWTVLNIRPQPSQFPIVDDHVWHIIARGYGTADQINDVLNTLATYAGFKTTWFYIDVVRATGRGRLYLTAIEVGDQWHLFDPYYGNTFRRPDGGLATWEELAADPLIAAGAPHQPEIERLPYHSYFAGLVRLKPSMAWSRGSIQQPWPRLKYEVRRWLGLLQPRKSRVLLADPKPLSKAP